jgi:rod shape-determining protein MreD
MGYFLALPILGLAAILQVGLLPRLLGSSIDFGFIPILNVPLKVEIYDGQLGLVLIMVLAWAVHAEIEEAVFWAFVGGIFQDVLNPIIPTGVSVIAFLLIIFAIKALEQNFYRFSIVLFVSFVLIGTVGQHLGVFLALILQNYDLPVFAVFQTFTVPSLGINLLASLPFYFLLRYIQKHLPRRQNPWGTTRFGTPNS